MALCCTMLVWRVVLWASLAFVAALSLGLLIFIRITTPRFRLETLSRLG
jgi:hypothetical protein